MCIRRRGEDEPTEGRKKSEKCVWDGRDNVYIIHKLKYLFRCGRHSSQPDMLVFFGYRLTGERVEDTKKQAIRNEVRHYLPADAGETAK